MGGLIYKLGSIWWCLRQKKRKCSCQMKLDFAGLDPLVLATLLATVHPRCMRLVLNLDGSTEIHAQEGGNGTIVQHSKDIVVGNQQLSVVETWLALVQTG